MLAGIAAIVAIETALAWAVLALPEADVVARAAVLQEGNSIRILPSLFRLFHTEPLRMGLVRCLAANCRPCGWPDRDKPASTIDHGSPIGLTSSSAGAVT